MNNNNYKTYTKQELLTDIKRELYLRDINSISVISILKIADILNIDLSDSIVEGVK